MYHVLERTKLEVSPGKSRVQLRPVFIIGVLSALLGELHLPRGKGLGDGAWLSGCKALYLVRRQSVLLSALSSSDRMWAPKVSRRSWGLMTMVHGGTANVVLLFL